MASIGEQFGANLVRVIKKVKRRSPDGGVQVVKQAFHVKKARPNDEYSGNKGGTKVPPMPKQKKAVSPNAPILDPAQQQADPAAAQEPAPPPTRMFVRYHDIPWIKKRTKSAAEREDPVPASLRKRYDKGNRHLQTTTPSHGNTPAFSVMPTDRILWGVDEPDLMMDLKSGYVRKMKVVKPNSGMMLARIEAQRGGSYSTYLWIEALREPVMKSIWGDLVDLENEGALARRSSAAYEVAKACGLDDVVPPSVHRYDEEGDMMSVLPNDLVEHGLAEWIARETGDHPDDVRKRLGGHSLIQLVRDRLWTIEEEEWFKAIFQRNGESGQKDVLNRVWEEMPSDRRISLLRLAVFDFIVWNMDRSLGDLAFCDNPKHPVVSYGNEMTVPCPRCLGRRYAESGATSYGESPGTPAQARPILWNDLLTMLAVRGGEAELEVCEQIGLNIGRRMRSDRANELARALLERGLTSLQAAGVMSRIWMLVTHSKDVARDPYFAPRYYASLISGGSDPDHKGFTEFVNQSMQNAIIDEFSFSKEIKKSGDGHAK